MDLADGTPKQPDPIVFVGYKILTNFVTLIEDANYSHKLLYS